MIGFNWTIQNYVLGPIYQFNSALYTTISIKNMITHNTSGKIMIGSKI